MLLEAPLRIIGLVGVVIGTGLVTMHARACASQEATVVTISVAVAVAVAPAVDCTPTISTTPTIPITPTVTVPCADSTTELLVDDHLPVLCWGGRCLAYRDDATMSVPRPASHPSHPSESGAVVSADRVCTRARCDRLGPKLRSLRDLLLHTLIVVP